MIVEIHPKLRELLNNNWLYLVLDVVLFLFSFFPNLWDLVGQLGSDRNPSVSIDTTVFSLVLGVYTCAVITTLLQRHHFCLSGRYRFLRLRKLVFALAMYLSVYHLLSALPILTEFYPPNLPLPPDYSLSRRLVLAFNALATGLVSYRCYCFIKLDIANKKLKT